MKTKRHSDRAWPLPNTRWSLRMNWHDLLFAHWRVKMAELRDLIPAGLEIDTYDGTPWLGIVPFRMTGVAPRYVPEIPFLSCFPELNVRTYVSIDGKPGIWFFSLEASNPIAVRVARKLFHLRYMDAKIEMKNHGELDTGKWIQYRSRRTHRGELPAVFEADYRPIGSAFQPDPGTLEQFLTSRYCLYTANTKGEIFRGEIDHDPWELREAQAIIKQNTMADWLGIKLPEEPALLHYAKRADALAWTIKKV